ncbi:sulfatase-like hydrolase/transferase [Rhodococcus sp. NPDC127528]|uniref:sulfatase-like hydrolase/transferase n=1 Tax=unclassified Rhodococcus (in: high G+C Gram-positive bacteria) TaxID=192944 RepID=UPI00363060F4
MPTPATDPATASNHTPPVEPDPAAAHGDTAGTEVPRRTFLGGAGALLAAGMVAGVVAESGAAQSKPAPRAVAGKLPARPNMLILITDQERPPMYWPPGWSERNLPNRQRIADHGLSFDNAFCSAAMCSPSRSTFFTGLYPAQHGVVATLTTGGTVSPTEPVLSTATQNMARVLAAAGYDVQFRGKWHMSKGADGGDASTEDVAEYGFKGWQPPEAGQDTNPANFGGGCANRDQKIADEAVEFLNSVDPHSDTPFALVVSMANPHDLLAYPQTWNAVEGDCDNYGSAAPGCFEQGIDLPPTIDESLLTNFKPTAQVQSQVLLAAGLGPLLGPQSAHNYVNFYGYLQKVVDRHIGSVLDALEAKPGLVDKTVIVRFSDHGEMGLSHGGLRQKIFNAYEETLRVPLVISNPVMFPQPVRTGALASLIDVLPTLATLAGVAGRGAWNFLGTDLTPVIDDAVANPASPTATVQDNVLFTYDDQNCATPDGQFIVTQPNHLRCIREGRYKYVMYFDPARIAPSQYELYDLQADPQELHNLADPANIGHYRPDLQAQMHGKLYAKMAATGTTPPG